MSTNITHDEILNRPEIERVAEGIIIVCIGTVAIVGNISLWIIICRSRELRTVTNSFILCLATADLLVSIFNMPLTAWTVFVGRWTLGGTMCEFTGYMNMLTLVGSVMSLCNISISRYVMVCRPELSKTFYTPRNAGILIAGIV